MHPQHKQISFGSISYPLHSLSRSAAAWAAVLALLHRCGVGGALLAHVVAGAPVGAQLLGALGAGADRAPHLWDVVHAAGLARLVIGVVVWRGAV